MTHSRHNLADQQHTAPRVVRHSPHVLNLQGTVMVVAEPIRPQNKYRGPFAAFHNLLDQRLHLKEWRHRTVSVRTRGWRDFPPAEATTLAEAFVITAGRFVDEHPMADLTVVSLVHLAILTVWKGFIMPAEHVAERVAASRRRLAAAKPVAAVKPSVAVQPVVAVKAVAVSAKGVKATKVSLLARLRRYARNDKRVVSFYASITKLEARLRKLPVLTFRLPRGYKASVAGFAAMALLMVAPISAYGMMRENRLPIRTLVLTAREAAGTLVAAANAAQSMDFAAANDKFQQAETGFAQAGEGLGTLGRAVSYVAAFAESNSQLAAAAPLLDAGRETAAAGIIISDTMRRIAAHPEASNVDKLRLLDGAVVTALPHVEAATRALDAVPVDAVPAEYRDRIAQAKAEAPRALEALRQASPALQFLISAAGGDGLRRYMLVFQNQTELRATGGFIGSFAVVDIKNGKMEAMSIPGGGSYDLQGQMKLRVASPQPLHLINPHWQFQDANWYPNFPTSASLLSRFYEQSGGTTVDGIVAINASVMVRLLRVFGAVDMPEYGKVIDADNFLLETQKAVELEYDKEENKPKQFLADLAPKIIERILMMEPATAVVLGRELLAAATERETTVWMRQPAEQEMVARLGWDGSVRATADDYLMIVHSNIAGQKTDGVMSDIVDRTAKILPDGSVIVTLALTRTHAGEKRALFNGVRNVDYVRFYVPLGAELIEARGFEAPDPKLFKIAEDGFIAEEGVAAEEQDATYDRTSSTRVSVEAGKTVFGNWLQTDPGESTAATVIYRLPAGFVRTVAAPMPTWLDQAKTFWQAQQAGPTMAYALDWQKQSGANPIAITSSVELPQGWFTQAAAPAVAVDERGRQTLTAALDRDRLFSLTATTAVR